MRITCLLCCCWCLFYGQLEAQTSENKNALTYKFVVTDYNSLHPSYIVSYPGRILHPEDVNYAGEIGYFRTINSSLNLGMPIRLGSMDSYHARDSTFCPTCAPRKQNEFFVGADIVAVYKFNNNYLLKENFFIAPYIFLGVGGLYLSQRIGNFDFQLPVGVGINIKLTKLLYLQGQFEYRKSFVIEQDNLAISFGIAWLLDFEKKPTN